MADLYCKVAEVTSDAELLAEVFGVEAAKLDSELDAEFTSDAAAEAAARPRDLTPSVVGFELRVDGVALDLADCTGGWSVSRSLDQRLQTWQVEFVLNDEDGPLGNPFDVLGPPTCLKTVDLYGVYLISGAKVAVPLIVGGIADMTTRTGSLGGYIESMSGVDRGGRHDRKVVTLVLQPGHGLPRGRVVRELAKEAGETQYLLDDGRLCTKEVQVVDGDWTSVAAELMDTEGRALLWNRDGYLTNPKRGRPVGETSTWELTEADFDASSGVSVSHMADILTDVTLTGWQQIARDGCDREEKTTETEVRTIYAPYRQGYTQTIGGYAATSPGEAAKLRRYSLVVQESESICNTVVFERTRRFGWRNWEVLRYQWDGTDDEWDKLTCYTDENSDGSAPGYSYLDERWSLLERVDTRYYYDRSGFRLDSNRNIYTGTSTSSLGGVAPGLWNAPPIDWVAYGRGDGGGNVTDNNFYLGRIIETWQPYRIEGHIKERGQASDPFPDEPDNGSSVYGDGRADGSGGTAWFFQPGAWAALEEGAVSGVSGSTGEGLMLVGVDVQASYDELDGGWVTREVTDRFRWFRDRTETGLFFYASDGTASNYENEQFEWVTRETTTYTPLDEATHVKQVSTANSVGAVVNVVTETGLEGYGPALPRLDLEELSGDGYETGEQDEFARSAARKSTKQIKVQVIATGLETCHTKGVLKTEMPWAEDEDELVEIAERMIADSAAATISATLAGCNYFVEPGQLHRWKFRPIGLDHDIRITSVTWSGSVGGRATCTVEGKVYGW